MPKLNLLSKILFFIGFLSTNSSFAEKVHVFKTGQKDSIIEYRILLPKDTFFLYEGVAANVRIKNVSSKPFPYYPYLSDEWIIYDEGGKNYPPTDVIDRLFPLDWKPPKLKPGDSLVAITGLSDQGTWDSTSTYPSNFLPMGKYTARYPPDTIPFTFYVVAPTGEEAEALKLFLDAFYPSRRGTLWKLPTDGRRLLMKETAEKLLLMADYYPKSIYAYEALYRAAITFWMTTHEHERWHQVIQRMIKDYPSVSSGQIDLLRSYYKEKDDFSGYKMELKNIIKRKAHPKLTETAKKALKNAKKEFYYDELQRKKQKNATDNLKPPSQ